jgi:pSer/pThr/pTyr-binding forkhead associated (FHA) protein
MKCPVCGAEQPEGAGVCERCGTALDRTIVETGKLRPLTGDEAVAPDAPPRADIEARCLLSSVLSTPIRLEEGSFYRIGRDRTSDICFPSTHVSRLHAEIVFERGQWAIHDLGSRNGTLVNGQRTLKRPLRDGDKIGIGHFEILYREMTRVEIEALRARKTDRQGDTLALKQDEVGFFGDVRKLSVVEVVQLLGQNRKTGILTVVEEKNAPERRLAFLEGSIIHAEFGSLEGERAVPAILRTRTGKFAFRPTTEATEKVTVETPTSTLLFQAIEAIHASEER